jgi:hypothetical protein
LKTKTSQAITAGIGKEFLDTIIDAFMVVAKAIIRAAEPAVQDRPGSCAAQLQAPVATPAGAI